ncbi:hypothetical protein TRFO_04508 [Tritrichomonas foetus]|uniref:Uncharacterized protein n=1 Tax=Tritrichomonas foetus TaxID=1144522 RepID=A0A1J4KJC4_9EUKA|nr:hypothetical protein TRFO_04508 [Tritrichomonas foetus]|eukprot:OHT09453.1 hypothetical protein TRFO_04508 [Tritrichomonas foetus]
MKNSIFSIQQFDQATFIRQQLEATTNISSSSANAMKNTFSSSDLKNDSLHSFYSYLSTGKINDKYDAKLIASFNYLNKLIQDDLTNIGDRNCKDNHHNDSRHDNNIDKDAHLISLFSRSDSLPVSLSSFAKKTSTMEDLILIYVQNPGTSEFAKSLNDNNFMKNSQRTAFELLSAICSVVDENDLPNVADLVNDMLLYRYYSENQLKVAFSNVANENHDNIEFGKTLMYIYALLITKEVFTFDDFKEMFSSMKNIWPAIIPYLFCEIDNMLGSWVDDLAESEFWSNLEFFDADERSVLKLMETLNAWRILDIFPEYDIAYSFYEQARLNNASSEILVNSAFMPIDHQKLVRIVYELLLTLNDYQMEVNCKLLKGWFNTYVSNGHDLLSEYGEKGIKLASMIW